MTELERILSERFPSNQFKDRICNLADKMNIVNETEVYNYDKIKDSLCKNFKCASADALHVEGDTIELIEFKTGFSYVGNRDQDYVKLKKAQQRISIRLKACESLMLLEKVIASDCNLDCYRKKYIAVIDSSQNSLDATIDFIKRKAENQQIVSDKDVLYNEMNNSLIGYRKEIGGKKVFYDDIVVLFDYEFV